MALYEVIGAAFIVAFSALLVYLVFRLIREQRDSERAWASWGGTPLIRFRLGADQWHRFLRLELARHLRFCAIGTAIGLPLLLLVFGITVWIDTPSIAAFLREGGAKEMLGCVGFAVGVGVFVFVFRAGREHLLRWAFVPARAAEVSIFATGMIIGGAAVPWGTPNSSLLEVVLSPDRDVLDFKLERRERQDSGESVWLKTRLRLPIPPGLDVRPVLAGVKTDSGHGDDERSKP